MKTSNRIQVSASFERLFDLAANIARWPQILPHYRWVKILERGSNVQSLKSKVDNLGPWTLDLGLESPYVVAEMAARHKGVPLWWRTIQRPRPEEKQIHFTHIGGITKGMEVLWTFTPIRHPPRPLAGDPSKPIHGSPTESFGDDNIDWLVQIYHQFSPSWPGPGKWFADHVIGDLFVRQIADKTLKTIKEILECRGGQLSALPLQSNQFERLGRTAVRPYNSP